MHGRRLATLSPPSGGDGRWAEDCGEHEANQGIIGVCTEREPIGGPPGLRCLFMVFGFEFTIGIPNREESSVGLRRATVVAVRGRKLRPCSAGEGSRRTYPATGGRRDRHTAKPDLLGGSGSRTRRAGDLSTDTQGIGIKCGMSEVYSDFKSGCHSACGTCKL